MSDEGNRYATVLWDDQSGYITGFFSKLRSDIPQQLHDHIKSVKTEDLDHIWVQALVPRLGLADLIGHHV